MRAMISVPNRLVVSYLATVYGRILGVAAVAVKNPVAERYK